MKTKKIFILIGLLSFIFAIIATYVFIHTEMQGHGYDWYCTVNHLNKDKEGFVPLWQCGNETLVIIRDATAGMLFWSVAFFLLLLPISFLAASLFRPFRNKKKEE